MTDLVRLPRKGDGPGLRAFAADTGAFLRALLRPPRRRPDGVRNAAIGQALPRGDGRPVLVLPGFLTSDRMQAGLVRFLCALGHDAQGWGKGVNWGPTPRALAHARARLLAIHATSGQRVTLVGHSLGGLFARELARERPDLVRLVVTLGTPLRFPLPTPLAPLVWPLKRAFDPRYLGDPAALAETPPVPLIACYSRRDGIVPWRACIPDAGPGVTSREIESHHTVMGGSIEARRIIALALAAPEPDGASAGR
ncbi:MAG: alpha/beta fold hydrolase [Alphaproteobacteria bacterium]|nr:alpha/beta fold hydrolase [Alphaproteobacteria bacterium]